jgi:hypothetical protein
MAKPEEIRICDERGQAAAVVETCKMFGIDSQVFIASLQRLNQLYQIDLALRYVEDSPRGASFRFEGETREYPREGAEFRLRVLRNNLLTQIQKANWR